MIIPGSLIPPQSHAESRVDESGSGVPCSAHDLSDVLYIILYKRQNRHKQDPCIKSRLRKLSDHLKTLRGTRDIRFDLRRQFIVGSCHRNLKKHRRMLRDTLQDIYIPGKQSALRRYRRPKPERVAQFQRMARKHKLPLERIIWIAHGSGSYYAASRFPAQIVTDDLKCVLFGSYLIKIIHPIAL